jgi:hypothetical protein
LIGRPAVTGNGRFDLVLPKDIPDFPWCGRRVSARFVGWDKKRKPAPFELNLLADRILDQSSQDYTLLGNAEFFYPPFRSAPGKRGSHVQSVARYLQLSPELKALTAELYPPNPVALLDAALSAKGILNSPIRIGLSPDWVQSGRFHKCPTCRRAMRLVVQLDGYLVHPRLSDGRMYLFGCERHPRETKIDEDWY